MKTGRVPGKCLILLLPEGKTVTACTATKDCMNYNYCRLIHIASYLNSLVPQFNKVAIDHLENNLRSRADGKTVVNMEDVFLNAALQFLSIVCMHVPSSV